MIKNYRVLRGKNTKTTTTILKTMLVAFGIDRAR